MTGWVRYENTMPENLKVAPVTDRAFRLWIHAGCYCSRAQTNGRVPAAIVTALSASATRRTVAELVDARLFERLDEKTYLVHDYLDYNPSRERIEQMRENVRERVAQHREQRGSNAVTEEGVTPLQERYPRARDRSGMLTDPDKPLNDGKQVTVGADEPPSDFPDELGPHLDLVCGVLKPLAERQNAKAVKKRSVAYLIADPTRRHKPFVRAAHEFAAWADSKAQPRRDVIAGWRNWLDKCDDLAGVEQVTPRLQAVNGKRDFSKYDRAAGL